MKEIRVSMNSSKKIKNWSAPLLSHAAFLFNPMEQSGMKRCETTDPTPREKKLRLERQSQPLGMKRNLTKESPFVRGLNQNLFKHIN